MVSPPGPISFTVGDEETPAAALKLTAQPLNAAMVPLPNIKFGGSGAARTVTITPTVALTGTATITVSVSHSSNITSEGFGLTVVQTEYKLCLPVVQH